MGIHCWGDPCGRPIRINPSTSPSISVGARVDDAVWCGPLWSPAGWGVIVFWKRDVQRNARTWHASKDDGSKKETETGTPSPLRTLEKCFHCFTWEETARPSAVTTMERLEVSRRASGCKPGCSIP